MLLKPPGALELTCRNVSRQCFEFFAQGAQRDPGGSDSEDVGFGIQVAVAQVPEGARR